MHEIAETSAFHFFRDVGDQRLALRIDAAQRDPGNLTVMREQRLSVDVRAAPITVGCCSDSRMVSFQSGTIAVGA